MILLSTQNILALVETLLSRSFAPLCLPIPFDYGYGVTDLNNERQNSNRTELNRNHLFCNVNLADLLCVMSSQLSNLRIIRWRKLIFTWSFSVAGLVAQANRLILLIRPRQSRSEYHLMLALKISIITKIVYYVEPLANLISPIWVLNYFYHVFRQL